MTPHSNTDNGDSFSCGGQPLVEAVQARAAEVLADVAALDQGNPPAFPEALPIEAAVACGNCLLFAGKPSAQPFPDWLAEPAAMRLEHLLGAAIADAERLPEDWQRAEADEADDLVAAALEARMNAWAALETLDAVPQTPRLGELIAACEKSLATFDEALSGRMDYLATLADTQLLANWRLSLAEPHRDPLPWWLDGRLEAVAVAVERAVADMERGLQRPPVTRPAGGSIAEIRKRVVQAYAAAADVPMAGAGLAPLIRWRSPDGLVTGSLLPPPGGPEIEPTKLLVEFTADQADALSSLRGCVAVVGDAGALIQWRTVAGEQIPVAEFPAEAMIGFLPGIAQEVPSLVLMPDGGEWEPVATG